MKYVIPGLALLLFVIAVVFGHGHREYKRGQKDLLIKLEQARIESIERRKEIEDEVQDLSENELLNRALRFVRPSDVR